MKHRWVSVPVGPGGQRCIHCDAERMPDPGTRSLYVYRRGRAIQPNRKPLSESWIGFTAGVIPKCPGSENA